tara:strand:+ start:124 stop:459 length:336 start_codon:yes stop_codon:yes gene_type:complete
MKTFTSYTEGPRRKTIAYGMRGKKHDSDVKTSRGGVERYDKYDKGSPKVKKDILQKELEYYLSDRFNVKSYKELNKNQKDELWDDIDDKFQYNTKTYKKGSLKINSSGKVT